MKRSSPTLLFKLPTHSLPTLYLLPLYPSYTLMSLASFLYLLFPLPPLICSWFFNGMPKAFETGVLNYHTLYCFIRRISPVFRNPTVTHPYSFRIPGFYALQPDCTHSRTGILSFNDPHASDGIIIFARQGLFFSELSISSLSLRMAPTLNSSSLFFFNVCAPPICFFSTDSKTDSFFSSRNLSILGLQPALPPLGLKKYF